MISFAPDDDEKLLAESARSFAQQKLRPRLRAHEEARSLPDELRGEFHALGMVGLDLPEALGFGGVSLLTRALIEEELAAGDPGAAFALDAVGLGGQIAAALDPKPLAAFIEDPQRAMACAASEAGPELRCAAAREGGAWVLRGEKRGVLGAARAQALVVVARVEEGLGAFAVDLEGAGRWGLQIEEDPQPLGLAELPACAVRLDGVRAERLGEGDARPALRAVVLRQAMVGAARAVGCARAAFEVARRYAGERSAFGKPIGHFQSIAFLLADMAMELEGARALVWRGCKKQDEPSVAQAVAQARDAAFFVTANAVQILGGAGFVQDHPVEKWMRDAKAMASYALPATAAQAICSAHQLGSEPTSDDVLCFTAPQSALT